MENTKVNKWRLIIEHIRDSVYRTKRDNVKIRVEIQKPVSKRLVK